MGGVPFDSTIWVSYISTGASRNLWTVCFTPACLHSFFDVHTAVSPSTFELISFFSSWRSFLTIHPGRLTWNLQITHLERKMILQASMIMFHVNLPGCRTGGWEYATPLKLNSEHLKGRAIRKRRFPTWSSHHWKHVSHVKLLGGVTPQFGGFKSSSGWFKKSQYCQKIAPNNKHAIQEISNRTHVSRTPTKTLSI